MTRNQIEYWKLQESKRSNAANERETARHNVATEGITQTHYERSDAESERHNRATEGIDISRLAEQSRHNRVTESQTDRQLDISERQTTETERHNRAGETISIAQLGETSRHNRASESLTGVDLNIRAGQLAETQRHNEQQEYIDTILARGKYALDKANAALANAKEAYVAIDSLSNYELNSARKQQLDSAINKATAEISQIEQNMSYKNYDEVLKGLDTLSRLLSSLDDVVRAYNGLKGSDNRTSEQKWLDQLDAAIDELNR